MNSFTQSPHCSLPSPPIFFHFYKPLNDFFAKSGKDSRKNQCDYLVLIKLSTFFPLLISFSYLRKIRVTKRMWEGKASFLFFPKNEKVIELQRFRSANDNKVVIPVFVWKRAKLSLKVMRTRANTTSGHNIGHTVKIMSFLSIKGKIMS